MNTPTHQAHEQPRSGSVPKYALKAGLFVLVQALALFLSAGSLDWGLAWVYVGFYALGSLASTWILARTSPGLLEERGEIGAGTKTWDIVLALIVGRLGPLATLVVAGLDWRYSWSPSFSPVLPALGFVVALLGYRLTLWAMATNRFFSGVVRIQSERNHTVATGGPYSYVRHPGYAGIGLFMSGTPLLLGSLWAFLPAGLTLLATGVRTALEDRVLHHELEGYGSYARRVRYRLLPGVW